MSKYLSIAGISLVLILALVSTLLTFRQKPNEAVLVELGIQPSNSPHIEALELASVVAYERGQFSKELSARLAKPSRTVTIDGFLADQCEVSQLEWEQFVEWVQTSPGFTEDADADWLKSKSSGHRITGRLDSPASGINYRAATAYCESVGGRLPYAEEFEAMASGRQGWIYPWGNEFSAEAWSYNSPERNASKSCGLHPSTTSPRGLHDLASNAMEWSQGPMGQEPRDFKAGLHGAPSARKHNRALYALNSAWLTVDPDLKSHYVGFRCIYDQPPGLTPWRTTATKIAHVPRGEYTIGLPEDARLPLFLANMPQISGIQLQQLLHDDTSDSNRLMIERCEVNRDAYQTFLNDPLVRLGLYSNENEPDGIDYKPLHWEEQQAELALPVFGVNWWAADAYARWIGGRLPTVHEWRQVTAGPRGSSYAWGMEYDSDAANTGDDETGQLKVCGSADEDIASGVADLSGNLSEWTRSIGVSQSRITMWVQGGNWLLPGKETAQALFGRAVPLTHQSTSIGFRVVYD